MIAAVEFKKRIIGASVFCIIIGKLSHRKELSIIVLFVIDKTLEINFYYTVLFFGLTISLIMKSNREFLLDSNKVV